jgi:hypothetical protein
MPTNLVRVENDGTATVLATNFDKSKFDPALYGNNAFFVDSEAPVTSAGKQIPQIGLPFSTFSSASLLTSTVASTIGGQDSYFIESPSLTAATSQSVSSNIIPLAEQKIEGTGYGTFTPTELVFQSTIQPTVINYLSLGGVTATDYNPTIGTIGATGTFVGSRAAQFKGSYLDTDTAAAGISLPGFTSASYFLISGWLLLETTPSGSYNPVVITRSSSTGLTGTTSDSFRLNYDNADSKFKFHFSTTSTPTSTTGYQHDIDVSPAGITLSEWSHFAIAYSFTSGGGTTVSSYWNGNRIEQTLSGITGSLRGTKSSVYVGCDSSGKYPFKGWIDDLVISAGTTLEALRGFEHGSTAPVPSAHQDAGYYTVYYLSMDGPLGTSLFPCDTTNKICSNVAAQTGSLYVYGNIGVTSSRMWTPAFSGVCGGHAPYGASAGYIFGYDSGACWVPSAVTEISSGLTAAKQYRKDLADYTLRYYLGLTMYGISGASGDFKNLFSGSTYPSSFVYTPLESNLNYLKNIYDSIIVAGSTANVSIADANGTYYTFATAAAVNLYKDVLAYFNGAVSQFTTVNNRIDTQASFTSLKLISGPNGTALVSKLAASGNESLFISPISTVTKTSRSPENYWNVGVENIPLEYVP